MARPGRHCATCDLLRSLAAVHRGPVWQHVHVAGAARSVLHEVLQHRLWAHALGTVVLVLATSVLLSKLASATRERPEPQEAVVCLMGVVVRIDGLSLQTSDGVKFLDR